MNNQPFSSDMTAELAALAVMRDEDIDTDDIPEASTQNRAFAYRPGQMRPGDKIVRLCLDAEVIDWLERTSPDGRYQAVINRALREHIASR